MGTLGIPYAIKVGGLSSILYIVVIAILTCYTSGLIIEAQYDEIPESGDSDEEVQRLKSRSGYAAIGKCQSKWRLVSFYKSERM